MHFLATVLRLALVACTCVTFTSASPADARSETNAKRLARGLPPLVPKSLYNPSAVIGAKRSTPSSTPLFTFNGRVQVRKPDGTILGFLWNVPFITPGSFNHINPDSPDEFDLHLTLTTTSGTTRTGPLDIFFERFGRHFIGGSARPQRDSIGPGSPNELTFTTVGQTPPGSPPVDFGIDPFSDSRDESAIWFFDPVTTQLTAQWINPIGFSPAKPTTTIAIRLDFLNIFIVGDLAAWNAEHPGVPTSEVMLFLQN